MDLQSRLLDKDYLAIRLQEIKEIRRKELTYKIENSDRINSNSIYIEFYIKDTIPIKRHTLRISDHEIDCVHSQFIINPNDDLTKKKKAQFMRALELSVKKALFKDMSKKLDKISSGKENDLVE